MTSRKRRESPRKPHKLLAVVIVVGVQLTVVAVTIVVAVIVVAVAGVVIVIVSVFQRAHNKIAAIATFQVEQLQSTIADYVT